MSSDDDEKQKISATIMLEIIGKPPKHLVESLERIIKQMDEEKGVVVLKKDIKEPVPMKKKTNIVKKDSDEKAVQHDLYTTFAEIDVELEEIFNLVLIMFKYMPAHIEIVSPEAIILTNSGWNGMVNEFMRRLHNYNEVTRVLQIEKEILERKLKGLMQNSKKGEKEKN